MAHRSAGSVLAGQGSAAATLTVLSVLSVLTVAGCSVTTGSASDSADRVAAGPAGITTAPSEALTLQSMVAAASAVPESVTPGAPSTTIEVGPTSSAESSTGPSTAGSAGSGDLSQRDAADDFDNWLRAQPDIDDSGYIQSVTDPVTGATTLIWHGTSPLQAAAEQEAARRGIAVTITPWPYSAAELEAAALALYDHTDAFLDVGFRVNDISAVPPDFAGVAVCGRYDDDATPDDVTVQKLAATITDVPVRLDSDCDGAK